MSSVPKKKSTYDPKRKWGLTPENGPKFVGDGGGATYVVGGHVVNDSRTLYVSESMGREAQARAQRAGAKQDSALKLLMSRDKEGMRAVEKAREYGEKMKMKKLASSEEKRDRPKARTRENTESGEEEKPTPRKSAYTADVIKKLGFDPALRPGQKRVNQKSDIHSQVCSLSFCPMRMYI